MPRELHPIAELRLTIFAKFQNELVKQGMAGGDEAAKLLRQAVFKYLDQNSDFKHDTKIVIRVYANLRGLSKTYVDLGILPHINSFAEFVVGFNKAHPLFDFVDAGNHKEAADTKLKGEPTYFHTSHDTTDYWFQKFSIYMFTMSIVNRLCSVDPQTTPMHHS